jgi:hypothetical protein
MNYMVKDPILVTLPYGPFLGIRASHAWLGW